MLTPAQLCARIYQLETQLIQTDDALKAERTRSAHLAAACHAWARVVDLQAKQREPTGSARGSVPPIAGGAPRRVPLPAFGARAHGTDDGERMSFAEWCDRRCGRDPEDDWS